jgi:Xaa-Pro aminopeptidase
MTSTEFRHRRQQLMRLIGTGSAAVVPGARIALRNRDTHFPFRQDSDFYYLTGFTEPDAVLVLVPGRAPAEVILFCAERNPGDELWHGERAGPERAAELFGMDDAFPVDDLPDILPGLLEQVDRVCIDLGRDTGLERAIMAWFGSIGGRSHARAPEIVALAHSLHELRLHKSPAEQKLLRRAAKISAGAHVRAMRAAAPGWCEADLEAELIHEFIRNRARDPAYPCIVAAGANACVLHYARNDGPLRDGELVLVDAGCEYQHYAADLTRTYPINGRFSSRQRALYEVVLEAQRRAIALVRPGTPFNRLHDVAAGVLIDGLRDLGVLATGRAGAGADGTYRRFCAPAIAHWIGLDVHDVGGYRIGSAWRELESGMVMTIEPGVYLPDSEDVVPELRGTGIRVEDVVLVTRTGHEVLTSDAPSEVGEIEALMAAARDGRSGRVGGVRRAKSLEARLG